jgi:hypothetical protein
MIIGRVGNLNEAIANFREKEDRVNALKTNIRETSTLIEKLGQIYQVRQANCAFAEFMLPIRIAKFVGCSFVDLSQFVPNSIFFGSYNTEITVVASSLSIMRRC